jgi:transcription antitermination protein NusB
VTDPDDPRAEAAADRRDDAPRPEPSDHSPLAFPRHLLPVEADEDAEVVLEEVITASDDGKRLRPRREARETALVLLYEAEARGVDPREVLDAQIVAPLNYTAALLSGISEHLGEADALITQFARDWRIERMPSIDRCLLRLAVFELAHRSDVPTAVVLAEAVELASRYSTEDSSRFVNGILSRIADHLGREASPDASKDRGIGNNHR